MIINAKIVLIISAFFVIWKIHMKYNRKNETSFNERRHHMLYFVAAIVGLIVALFSVYIMSDQKFPRIQTLFTSFFCGRANLFHACIPELTKKG